MLTLEEFKEFCALVDYKNHDNEDKVKQIYDMIDVDKNGGLDIDEFA